LLELSATEFGAKKQQAEKGFCVDHESCKNNMLCLNNTCVLAYSQKNGTYIGKDAPDSVCEFGYATTDSPRRCASYNYLPNATVINGFVACNLGDDCVYTTYLRNEFNESLPYVTQKCQCGYSTNGTSYCPMAHTQSTSDWTNYFQDVAKRADNKCHTTRHKNTAASSDDGGNACGEKKVTLSETQLGLKLKSRHAHLYHGASSCIIAALSSNYLSVGISLLVVLISLLF